MSSPLLRATLALLLFTAWLALLFAGLAAGGAVHLLLVAAAGLFPWPSLRASSQKEQPTGSEEQPTLSEPPPTHR